MLNAKVGGTLKVGGKDCIKEVKQKVVACRAQKCPFGLKRIDLQCAVCRYKLDVVINNIKPIFIEVEEQVAVDCYTNKGLALHDKCPFGLKKMDMKKCINCCRLQRKVVTSCTTTKTEGY